MVKHSPQNPHKQGKSHQHHQGAHMNRRVKLHRPQQNRCFPIWLNNWDIHFHCFIPLGMSQYMDWGRTSCTELAANRTNMEVNDVGTKCVLHYGWTFTQKWVVWVQSVSFTTAELCHRSEWCGYKVCSSLQLNFNREMSGMDTKRVLHYNCGVSTKHVLYYSWTLTEKWVVWTQSVFFTTIVGWVQSMFFTTAELSHRSELCGHKACSSLQLNFHTEVSGVGTKCVLHYSWTFTQKWVVWAQSVFFTTAELCHRSEWCGHKVCPSLQLNFATEVSDVGTKCVLHYSWTLTEKWVGWTQSVFFTTIVGWVQSMCCTTAELSHRSEWCGHKVCSSQQLNN